MKFLRKTLCFTKFPTFMNLFGHWAKNFQSFVLLCSSAGPSKKQPMRPEVVCDEKQKVSNVSKKGVFSWLFTDYDRKSLHFRKKVILLVLKSLFYVSRGTFSEKIKIFVSKSSFSFVKSCWALSQIISDFWGSCFRQGFHHSVLLLPRKVSGKKFSKKVFFSLFPDLEQKIDYWKNIKMNVKTLFYVSGGGFLGKTFFLKLFDIFFLVFRAKNCKF